MIQETFLLIITILLSIIAIRLKWIHGAIIESEAAAVFRRELEEIKIEVVKS